MKVLLFTYDFPYPTTTGGKNRAYHMLKFGGSNIELFLFSFTREGFDPLYQKELEKIGVKDITLFKRKKLKDLRVLISSFSPFSSIFKNLYFDKEVLKRLIEFVERKKIDIVHYESLYTAFYICREIKQLGAKQIFGTENIEHKTYSDYAKYRVTLPLKPIYFYQIQKIKREEEELLKAADESLAVSEQEAEWARKVSGKDCFIIENGVDVEYFKFQLKKRTNNITFLFVGNFSYFPNMDAVEYFYDHVFKKLTNLHIKFLIVGKGSSELSFVKDGRVHTLEYIPDIRDAYKRADIFVSPVRIGGGTNFKILEAMASGIPVVALPSRVTGLGVEDGKHLLLGHNADSFQSQIEKLIKDSSLGARLAKNARQLVEEKFDWKVIGEKLNSIWNNLKI